MFQNLARNSLVYFVAISSIFHLYVNIFYCDMILLNAFCQYERRLVFIYIVIALWCGHRAGVPGNMH